jgi:hypothetical protein
MERQVGTQASSTISGFPRGWHRLAIEEMSAQVPYGVGLTIKAPAASGCFCQACSTCSGEGGCATCSRVS